MWKNSKRVAAFTLIECLVALVVLSGGLLVFTGLTKLISQEIHYEAQQTETDWLLFSEQFRLELEETQFVKVEQNRLYVDKKGQALAFGQSKSDDFRKTNDQGRGYQPMLYRLKSTRVTETAGLVSITFSFQDGLERTFLYVFDQNR
ncbi:competence type IV pilus minor pilin ComGF [Streptococcus cameli]